MQPVQCCSACYIFVYGVVSIFVAPVFVFVTVFRPQANALAHSSESFPTWAAYFIATILTILELAIVVIIVGLLLIPLVQDALYDATINARKRELAAGLDLVRYVTMIPRQSSGDYNHIMENDGSAISTDVVANEPALLGQVFGCFRGLTGGIGMALLQLAALIVTFPLNGIPVLGTVSWVVLNGWILAFDRRLHGNISVLARRF